MGAREYRVLCGWKMGKVILMETTETQPGQYLATTHEIAGQGGMEYFTCQVSTPPWGREQRWKELSASCSERTTMSALTAGSKVHLYPWKPAA